MLLGLAVAMVAVIVVSVVLSITGEPEPRRTNLVIFTAILMIPLFLVWCALVFGSALASKLRTVTLPGEGLEALVLGVALQDRKWAARRFGRLPAAARILVDNEGLMVTWADRTSSRLRWSEVPQLTRRKVWAAYRRADAVRVTSGDLFVEYVPFDAGGPMSGTAAESYFRSIMEITSG